MKTSASLGFIIPNNWLTIDSFSALRKFLIETTSELKIINIKDKVFANANVDTAIIYFGKSAPSYLKLSEMTEKEEGVAFEVELNKITPPAFIIQIGLLSNQQRQDVLQKISKQANPLSSFCTVSTGLKAYQIGKGQPSQTAIEKSGRVFHSKTEETGYGKYLDGVDVRRYFISWSGQYLKYGNWLAEPRKSVPFSGDRILVRQIPSKPPYLLHGTFLSEEYYNDINSMVVFSPVENVSLKYLLGCLNSRLLSFWFEKTFDKLQRKIFPQFKVKELASFPIRVIDFSNKADKAKHDKMVSLVERMLTLHKQKADAQTAQEKDVAGRQIAQTDAQIDKLVYALYGLTAEEIEIVEGG